MRNPLFSRLGRVLFGLGAIFVVLVTLAWSLGVDRRKIETFILAWMIVPRIDFDHSSVPPAPDYHSLAAWIARPGSADDPSRATPPHFQPTTHAPVDVFFVPPTTYHSRQQWNAPYDAAEATLLQRAVARHFASAFNGIGALWIPHYRQATLGSFFTSKPDAAQALDLAYSDVRAAFDAFVAQREAGGPPRPFILAAHSQGSRHALQLLHDRIAGTALQRQMVAAYIVGWPISIEADLAPLGLDVCQSPQATNCVLSWQSFAEPANIHGVTGLFDKSPGQGGQSKRGTHMLCINPLNFWQTTEAVPRGANLGALAFTPQDHPLPMLKRGFVGAQCRADGILYLQPRPVAPFDERLLPGNNFHSYDYVLFWANVRANAEARVAAFLGPR